MAKNKEAANGHMSITMLLERETKGAVRYQEVDGASQVVDFQAAKIGTLYIRKSAFAGGEIPARITVTVSAS